MIIALVDFNLTLIFFIHMYFEKGHNLQPPKHKTSQFVTNKK